MGYEHDDFEGCSQCGIVLPENEYIQWGTDRLCPDCMEMICPSFDEEMNKSQTTAAYQEMRERYIGRKVKNVRSEIKRIDIDMYGRHSLLHGYRCGSMGNYH